MVEHDDRLLLLLPPSAVESNELQVEESKDDIFKMQGSRGFHEASPSFEVMLCWSDTAFGFLREL